MHSVRFFGAAALAAAAFLLLPALASAHGHREVGEYELTVGFFVEPAYEGEKNGIDLRVADAAGEPVEGVEATLQVEVKQEDTTVVFPLRTVFGAPGRYTADFFPTVPGQYTFRFFGTIGDLDVDESFTSEVDGFSSVEPREDLQFPVRIASARELQSAVEGSQESIDAAEDRADAATTRANIALGVGVLGILVGAGGLAAGMRRRS